MALEFEPFPLILAGPNQHPAVPAVVFAKNGFIAFPILQASEQAWLIMQGNVAGNLILMQHQNARFLGLRM